MDLLINFYIAVALVTYGFCVAKLDRFGVKTIVFASLTIAVLWPVYFAVQLAKATVLRRAVSK